MLKGTYRTTSVAAGNYVQGASGDDSFSPVEGLQFAAVASGAEPTLLPFRAYATAKVVTTEPENPDPDEPNNPDPDDPNNPDGPVTPDPVTGAFNLTVSSAGVATLYLGFDAVIPDADFLIVATVKSLNGNVAMLHRVRDVLPANTGVLIFANPGTYTFNSSSVAANKEESLLHGVLEDTPTSVVSERENGDYIYVLSRGTTEYIGFKPASSSLKTLGANKAYLPIEPAALVKEITFSFNGQEVTAIDDIKAAADKPQSDDIFDLSGRRVSNPAKGIYIIGGKKVLVK